MVIIPYEIIDIIIDFIDYQKYHKLKFIEVLNDILQMSSIFTNDNNLPPNIAYKCWGNGYIWNYEFK